MWGFFGFVFYGIFCLFVVGFFCVFWLVVSFGGEVVGFGFVCLF